MSIMLGKGRKFRKTMAFGMRSRTCAQCGQDVSSEVSVNREGEVVCAKCKIDPRGVAQHLLEMANAGDARLVSIRGYCILRELGRGGMGAVYLAQHKDTG